MKYEFTPAAQRAVAMRPLWLGRNDCSEWRGAALLLGLLAQAECRAAAMLARCRLDAAAVHARWPGLLAPEAAACGCSEPTADTIAGLEVFCHAAAARLADFPHPLVLATEHLLLGLAAAEGETATWLRQQGLDPDALQAEIHQLYGYQTEEPPLDMAEPAESPPGTGRRPVGKQAEIDLLRILDAAANRAREGLRVVEDYVRFALDDRHLTEQLKRLRHDLAAVAGTIAPAAIAWRPARPRPTSASR